MVPARKKPMTKPGGGGAKICFPLSNVFSLPLAAAIHPSPPTASFPAPAHAPPNRHIRRPFPETSVTQTSQPPFPVNPAKPNPARQEDLNNEFLHSHYLMIHDHALHFSSFLPHPSRNPDPPFPPGNTLFPSSRPSGYLPTPTVDREISLTTKYRCLIQDLAVLRR